MAKASTDMSRVSRRNTSSLVTAMSRSEGYVSKAVFMSVTEVCLQKLSLRFAATDAG